MINSPSNPCYLLLSLVILFCIAPYGFYYTWELHQETQYFLAEGRVTEAEITAIEKPDKEPRYVYYRYTLDGRTYDSDKESLNTGFYDDLKKGQMVDIYYLPDDPNKTMLVYNDRGENLALLLGLCLVVPGGGFIVMMIYDRAANTPYEKILIDGTQILVFLGIASFMIKIVADEEKLYTQIIFAISVLLAIWLNIYALNHLNALFTEAQLRSYLITEKRKNAVLETHIKRSKSFLHKQGFQYMGEAETVHPSGRTWTTWWFYHLDMHIAAEVTAKPARKNKSPSFTRQLQNIIEGEETESDRVRFISWSGTQAAIETRNTRNRFDYSEGTVLEHENYNLAFGRTFEATWKMHATRYRHLKEKFDISSAPGNLDDLLAQDAFYRETLLYPMYRQLQIIQMAEIVFTIGLAAWGGSLLFAKMYFAGAAIWIFGYTVTVLLIILHLIPGWLRYRWQVKSDKVRHQ